MSIFSLVPTSAHLNTGVGQVEDGLLTISYPCRLLRSDKIELATAEKWDAIEVALSARVKPAESLAEAGVGRVVYFEALKDDYISDSASVLCECFVSREQLGELIASARAGRMPTRINIEVEGMTYGNAPDGSEKRWDNKRFPGLKMESVRFNLPLIAPTVTEETDVDDASRVANEPPTRAQFESLIEIAATQAVVTRNMLKWILWAVVVLGVIIIVRQ